MAPQPDPTQEKCPRCLEPIPDRVARCPHCGQPIGGMRRMVHVMVGLACLFVMLFLAVVLYRSVYAVEPPPQEPAAQGQPEDGFGTPPETSAGHEKPAPGAQEKAPSAPASPEPDKKAPLDR